MDFNEYQSMVEKDISENKIVLYMRGNPDAPRCGFSARAVAVFDDIGEKYATVDLDQDRTLWAALKEINNWPTAPQIYVKGQFLGGCDDVCAMWESGDLQKMIKEDA